MVAEAFEQCFYGGGFAVPALMAGVADDGEGSVRLEEFESGGDCLQGGFGSGDDGVVRAGEEAEIEDDGGHSAGAGEFRHGGVRGLTDGDAG